MKEATAVAAALAEKVIVPQAGVTGMDSEIAATSVAVSATVGVAVAAVESVAVALAVNCNDGVVLGGNTTAGLKADVSSAMSSSIALTKGQRSKL